MDRAAHCTGGARAGFIAYKAPTSRRPARSVIACRTPRAARFDQDPPFSSSPVIRLSGFTRRCHNLSESLHFFVSRWSSTDQPREREISRSPPTPRPRASHEGPATAHGEWRRCPRGALPCGAVRGAQPTAARSAAARLGIAAAMPQALASSACSSISLAAPCAQIGRRDAPPPDPCRPFRGPPMRQLRGVEHCPFLSILSAAGDVSKAAGRAKPGRETRLKARRADLGRSSPAPANRRA